MGAAVISRQGRVLLRRRPSKGLLGGLWEFPKAELLGPPMKLTSIRKRLPVMIRESLGIEVRLAEPLTQVRHVYSHFEVMVQAFRCSTNSSAIPPGSRWVSVSRLRRYAMGGIDRKIAESLKQEQA
jgi:A/G-specific adenine glycosylase